MDGRDQKVKPLPIIIGPANAEAVTGWNWRWVRDTAIALGVPLIGRARKHGVRAELFLAALDTAPQQAPVSTEGATPEVDATAYVLGLMGKRIEGAR